jgi:hypothetical protein
VDIPCFDAAMAMLCFKCAGGVPIAMVLAHVQLGGVLDRPTLALRSECGGEYVKAHILRH